MKNKTEELLTVYLVAQILFEITKICYRKAKEKLKKDAIEYAAKNYFWY